MVDVVVIGAGGHAKVVIDLLRASGHSVVGCTSRKTEPSEVNGVPVLGTDEEVLPGLRQRGVAHAFVALGDNHLRVRVSQQAIDLGFELVNAIGASAVISPSAVLGRGCAIMEGAVVNACARIGDLAIINTNASVDHDAEVGAGAHVAPGCALAGCVVVGDGAFLGVGARAVPGVRIGADSTVGAGAVLIRDIPDNSTWVGVPARPITAK